MMDGRHAMLSPVLEISKATESYMPYGNHTTFQKLWLAETESSLQQTLEVLDISEKQREEAQDKLSIVSDALSLFVREAENHSWFRMSLEERQERVEAIKAAPQIPQRSEEWYKNYSKVLTASEFSALFSQNKRRRDLVLSKANPPLEQVSNYRLACPTEEMNALGWGIRFEPVIKQILEYKDKCTIYEPGRLQHKTNTSLAASPDGLIEKALDLKQVGRLVEIKCPYSRVIGKEIPSEYWIQMQIQMEVADVDECEYIEAELISKKSKQIDVDLSGTTYQGFVYLIQTDVDDGEVFDYKYLYGDVDSKDIPEIPVGYKLVETIPWGLKAWHRKIVQRDKTWYAGTMSWQEAFWKDVDAAKKGELAPHPVSKPTACLIMDD